jgi:hypothetical protein
LHLLLFLRVDVIEPEQDERADETRPARSWEPVRSIPKLRGEIQDVRRSRPTENAEAAELGARIECHE